MNTLIPTDTTVIVTKRIQSCRALRGVGYGPEARAGLNGLTYFPKWMEARMKIFTISVGLLLSLSAALSLSAQTIYTWTDGNGIVHIADQPPPKTDRLEDVEVIKYEEKTPQEMEAIQHKKESLRRQLDREEQIEKARRAEIQAKEAEKRAQEALQQAQEEYEYNTEYIRRLTFTTNKRRQLRKWVDRQKAETEASQAKAKAAVEQAEEAVRKARIAAEEAQTGTQE